jgi:hypothetical protein
LLLPEKRQEEDKVANKDQTYSLAYDKIRQKIYSGVSIVRDPIQNDSITIAKTYYDLTKRTDKVAIDYTRIDQKLEKGNNRTFINWFNVNSTYDPNKHLSNETFKGYYVPQKSHNLLENYDDDNSLGYRIFFEPDHVFLQINNKTFDFETEILTNVWYGLMVSLDQRQHKITFQLYRRTTDIAIIMFNKETYEKLELVTFSDLCEAYDPINTGYTYEDAILDGFLPVQNSETNYYAKENDDIDKLLLVDELEISLDEPFEFEHEIPMKLLGSGIKYTNLRIFDDVIKEGSRGNVMSEAIIRDEQHLIMYDNVNREIIATTYWNKRFE